MKIKASISDLGLSSKVDLVFKSILELLGDGPTCFPIESTVQGDRLPESFRLAKRSTLTDLLSILSYCYVAANRCWLENKVEDEIVATLLAFDNYRYAGKIFRVETSTILPGKYYEAFSDPTGDLRSPRDRAEFFRTASEMVLADSHFRWPRLPLFDLLTSVMTQSDQFVYAA